MFLFFNPTLFSHPHDIQTSSHCISSLCRPTLKLVVGPAKRRGQLIYIPHSAVEEVGGIVDVIPVFRLASTVPGGTVNLCSINQRESSLGRLII